MLLFPLPLGPTITVTPGSKKRVVLFAKDLNPFKVRDLRYMGPVGLYHEKLA
jgi:hypothetical protein